MDMYGVYIYIYVYIYVCIYIYTHVVNGRRPSKDREPMVEIAVNPTVTN